MVTSLYLPTSVSLIFSWIARLAPLASTCWLQSWLISFYYKKTPVNVPLTYYTDFDIDIDYFLNNRFSVGTGFHYEGRTYDDVIMEYWEHFSFNASFVSKEFQNGNRFHITYAYEPWRDDWKIYDINLYYIID